MQHSESIWGCDSRLIVLLRVDRDVSRLSLSFDLPTLEHLMAQADKTAPDLDLPLTCVTADHNGGSAYTQCAPQAEPKPTQRDGGK